MLSEFSTAQEKVNGYRKNVKKCTEDSKNCLKITQEFSDFVHSLGLKKKNEMVILRAFLAQTSQELEYLKSQI